MKRALVPVIAAGAAALVAGCGGGGSSHGSAAVGSAPSKSRGTAVDVRSSKLGRILVNGSGRTLYLFEKDKGPMSTCFGACASAWPPATTAARPVAGPGLASAKLTEVARKGGARQLVYNGHPLYFYAGDQGPGQTNGEGLRQFGAEWYVLSPAGNKVETGGS